MYFYAKINPFLACRTGVSFSHFTGSEGKRKTNEGRETRATGDARHVAFSKIGTLSKDDDDGSENVGIKLNLRSFKLNRVYLDPLHMSNAGDFSWS